MDRQAQSPGLDGAARRKATEYPGAAAVLLAVINCLISRYSPPAPGAAPAPQRET